MFNIFYIYILKLKISRHTVLYLLLCGADRWPFAEGHCNCIITGSQVHLPLELCIALFIHSYQLSIFSFFFFPEHWS